MTAMLGMVEIDGSSLAGRPAEASDDSLPHSSAKPFFTRIRLTLGAIVLTDSSGLVKNVPVVCAASRPLQSRESGLATVAQN